MRASLIPGNPAGKVGSLPQRWVQVPLNGDGRHRAAGFTLLSAPVAVSDVRPRAMRLSAFVTTIAPASERPQRTRSFRALPGIILCLLAQASPVFALNFNVTLSSLTNHNTSAYPA